MRKLIFLAAALTSFATLAVAQTVVISPEEETETRTYVTHEHGHFRPYEMRAGEELTVGRELPAEVELREVPKVPRYRAAIVGGRTVLVEPGTRRVVRIIER